MPTQPDITRVQRYSLSIGEWSGTAARQYNFVSNDGGYLPTTDPVVPGLTNVRWQVPHTSNGIGIRVPLSDDFAEDLPTEQTVEAWRAFQSRHLGLEFVGTYTPAYYNPYDGAVFAVAGIADNTDFLTAYAAAQAMVATAPALPGLANIRPWVIMSPRPDQFVTEELELIGEEQATAPRIRMPNTNTIKVSDDHEALGLRTCSGCGRAGHNIRTCTGIARAYDKVGIEIEGRWRDLNEAKRLAVSITGEEGYHDGSVRNSTTGSSWEFQTRPGSISSAIEQLHKLYPDEADQSCGMHVHVSFAPTDLFLLANEQFFTYFHDRWVAWGTRMNIRPGSQFWHRLNGDNAYCRINTTAPRDLVAMDRYFQLNFSSWDRHKTVECRLLPMFKHEKLAIAAVQELLSIYEDWFAMDHAGLLPSHEVNAPDYSTVPDITVYTVDPPSVRFDLHQHIEMSDLAPPAPGLTRVAIPVGRTMDNTSVLDRFTQIATQERQAA